MKLLFKYILILLLISIFSSGLFAREKVNINFRGLNIYDFVKITSKIIKKNILLTSNIKGKVDFISNSTVYKDEILSILIYALESKGFTIVENKDILRVVKLSDVSKYNIDIENVTLKNIQAVSVINDLKAVAKSIFNEKILKEKVDILLNKVTNSIMFVGKKENVKYMKNYLIEMERKGSLIEKVVEVVYLKNAESKVIITTITNIIGNKKYKDENNKPFASIDEESNAIILMGPKEEIKYLVSLIKKLDIDRQQVYVQAKIIEISESKTKDIGIKYGLNGFNAGGGSLVSFSSELNGGTAVDLSSLSGYGYDLTTMKDGVHLGMTLNLLNQNGAADIVSEPSLLCINNKESSIYVGQTISIKTGTTTTTSGIPTDTYKREDVGLTLKVKPRISNGNKVLLDINTKLEDVGQTTTNDNPNTSKKELLTSAIVNNGENIILGGYIRSKKEHTIDKVPLLGDIPILGSLFRNKGEVNDKINLVIIITPYIVPKTKDLTYVRNQLAQLKLLEDKYTKDTKIRLEAKSIMSKQEDLDRKNKKIELDEKSRKIDEKLNKLLKRKKTIEIEKKIREDDGLTENEKLQRERVKEILGI